jgi:hypothetical protein
MNHSKLRSRFAREGSQPFEQGRIGYRAQCMAGDDLPVDAGL